jgi:glycosyltransferase involved in cell wall biosynthesis
MIDVLVDMTALNTESRERGIGRYVRSLCLALARREQWRDDYRELGGQNLTLAGLTRHMGKSEGALDPSLTFAGTENHAAGLGYQRHKLERRLFMGGLLSRVDCRLAHLPDPPGTPFDRRRRRIVTCHDLIPLVLHEEYLLPLPGSRTWQRERDKARYKTAERVIAISAATRLDLVEQLGIAPERIDVVHHGVDHERFNLRANEGEERGLRTELGLSGPFLLYMGAGDARKNLPLLVRAFARSGVASDVSLVIAGPLSKRQRARLEQQVSVSQVTGRVKLLGYVPEELVTPLFRTCLAHVFPSSYEGFGLTLLEAMACGAPTLTTAFSALGEVASDAALTLKELAEEPFAHEISRLVSDAQLRAELRSRGLEHVKQFTWERCAAETLACYARALDGAEA